MLVGVGGCRWTYLPAADARVEVDGRGDVVRGSDVHGAGARGVCEVREGAVALVVCRRRRGPDVSVWTIVSLSA